jgi:hypothetical protein
MKPCWPSFVRRCRTTDADRRDYPDPAVRRQVLRQIETQLKTNLRILKEAPSDPLARFRWLGDVLKAQSECSDEFGAELEQRTERGGVADASNRALERHGGRGRRLVRTPRKATPK